MSIQLGNKKLGYELIHTFSLPPGKDWTCTHESKECADWCYTKGGFLGHMPSVWKSMTENYRLSRAPEFADWVKLELRRKKVRIMRIHVAGDFYDAEYTAKWLEVAEARKDVFFFAYTRSWLGKDMQPVLTEMARLRNVQMWWSLDRSMPRPTRVPGRIRLAYMQVARDDVPDYPVDLFFRVKPLRKEVRKSIGKALVCPEENGATRTECEKCKICWLPPKLSPGEKSSLLLSLEVLSS